MAYIIIIFAIHAIPARLIPIEVIIVTISMATNFGIGIIPPMTQAHQMASGFNAGHSKYIQQRGTEEEAGKKGNRIENMTRVRGK